jgi:nicotinamidase-related amidase
MCIRDRNIYTRAAEFIHYCDKYSRPKGLGYTPQTSALLVLDMQAYFLDSNSHAYIPSGLAIVPGLKALIKAYRSLGLPVIFTRHANSPQDAGMMSVWWRELIDADSPLSQIVPELDTGGSPVIQKTQYDAFFKTDLDAILCRSGVQQVLVGGVMTHLCCETTARSAFMHGFEVLFLVDGTATYSAAFHQAACLNLTHGFATPALSDDVVSALAKS